MVGAQMTELKVKCGMVSSDIRCHWSLGLGTWEPAPVVYTSPIASKYHEGL